jgi:hypothetical protein
VIFVICVLSALKGLLTDDEPDGREPCRLLRERIERPCDCRAGNSFNEIAAAHIILPGRLS